MNPPPLDSVPSDFVKYFLVCLAFVLTLGVNVAALWFKNRREVSGTVKTQTVQDFATEAEMKALETKHDAATERLLLAGEKRAENINKRLDVFFEKFDRKLLELRAELRAEFGELNRNAFQRLNAHGERLAALESVQTLQAHEPR